MNPPDKNHDARRTVKKGRAPEAPSQTIPCVEQLHRGDDDVALGILTLGVRDDTLVVEEREMHQAALVGVHRRERHLAVTLLGARGRGAGQILNLLLAAVLVALDVNDDRVIEPDLLLRRDVRTSAGRRGCDRDDR